MPVIKVLIEELGADHSPSDRWGGTPLNDAIRHKRHEVISYLKERGATLGQAATVSGDPATELCNAAAKADIEDLRFLVREKGYDVNVGDYDHRCAIHSACSEGNLDVVVTLIDELGADHSPSDRWGGTPLDDALRHGHEEVSAYLTRKGAKRGSFKKGNLKSALKKGGSDGASGASDGSFKKVSIASARGSKSNASSPDGRELTA